MSLTEAAYWTRRLGIIFGVVVIVAVIVIMVIFNIAHPDPLPEFLKADYACTLTADEFKQQALTIPTLQLGAGSEQIYEINTATGRLQELPHIAYVYKYNNPGPSLDSQRDSKKLAENLGLDPEAIILRGGLSYEWAEDNLGRSLSIDPSTMNFTFKTNFAKTDAYPTDGTLPSDTEAISSATAYLRGNGLMLDDYAKSKPEITYINILPNGTYSKAKSRAEAELIRVDFFRNIPFLSVRKDIAGAQEIIDTLDKTYNNYDTSTETVLGEKGRIDVYNFDTQIVNLDTQKGNISIYVGPSDRRKRSTEYSNIYQVDYIGWVIDREPCGTYDLISATEVTTIIENGNGSLVYLNENNGDYVVPYTPKTVKKFLVNDVVLAYLDSVDEQKFIQPIYIVYGEASLSNGIVGQFYYYIPAINYNVIQDRQIKAPTTDTTTKNNDTAL